ncbi:MAG: type II and III secretion system protein [Planctomycetes bacterium]|nr:type II and III secretion system protein [Planctomycetota bacterium]
MRKGSILLLSLLLLFVSTAAGQEPAPVPAPAAAPGGGSPAGPAPETLAVEEDGAISREGRVTRYWQVNHESPATLQKELESFLGADVKLMPKSQNILRIEAPKEKWPVVEKLLEVLDVPTPQVYVEAKIIEIKYDNNLELGVEATYDRREGTDASQPFFGKFTGNFNPESYLESVGTSTPFTGGSFEFETVGDSTAKRGEYTYILRALQERGSAEILSKPSIIAMQGKKAMITTGLNYPVQTVEVRGNQTFVTTKFEKTGIQLEITPQLVGRTFVSLAIMAKDSQITERVPGPEGSLNPVISERSANTEVSVRDGETIIIGGLLTSSTMESKRGLPLLSDIPLLGYLFSATRTQEVKSELVFFITPRIIKQREQSIILPPSERLRLNQ